MALTKHEIRVKCTKCVASVSYFVVYFAKKFAKHPRNAKYKKYIGGLKVHPHYAVWQGHTVKVAPCRKYMWMLRRLGCGMPFDVAQPKNLIGKLSVPSKEADDE